MKNNRNRHYKPAASNNLTAPNKTSPKGDSGELQKCDEETLAKLNQLVKAPPFSAWYRQRNNDPL